MNKFFFNETKQEFMTYLNSLTQFWSTCTTNISYLMTIHIHMVLGISWIEFYQLVIYLKRKKKEVLFVHWRFASCIKDAITVYKDTETKSHLYLGHKVRCIDQQISITNDENIIIQRLAELGGMDILSLIITHFKMKYEPQSSRETTLDHYGERSIGWHSVHVMYNELE